MKRWLAFGLVMLLGVTVLVMSEWRKVEVPPNPSAFLYLIADTEQELTRMPVSFTRMSDAEEIRLGDQIAREYSFRQQEKKDPEVVNVESYLTQVGWRLAARAHRKLPYRFHYVPEGYFINAFALPGGHVYVGGGLIALMDSEDELASVIGHEIEHIDHYHCAERAQQEQALRRIPLGGLIALPIELFEAGYSKDQELEADREGTRLAFQAGYSPNGAIRMFETFDRLYGEYRTKARTPQEELSQVALQTLEGYFRSHPLPSERIEQMHKLIADEGWAVRPERDLAIAYVFWARKAERVLQARQYQQAEQSALRSLQLKGNQLKALQVLAEAQFTQAHFAAAAASYRKLLDLDSSNAEAADAYALALAASGERGKAVAEFRTWMDSLKGEKSRGVQVPMAGLEPLAGNPQAARNAAEYARANPATDWSPEWLGRLGWWHYLAADYPTAEELLSQASQQRPGNARLTVQLGWTQIEERQFAAALQNLASIQETGNTHPDKTMAQAVALWLGRRRGEALNNFSAASEQQPSWKNPAWIKALYSPLVAQTVAEMQAEQENRRHAQAQVRR